MILLNFNRLSYFIEVVEARSINKAAKKLMLTPPSLLATINAMEKELACPLLIRTHNGVTPTYAGKILYDDAKNILAMQEKWNNFSLLNNSSFQSVEIAVPPTVQYAIMPQLAVLFLKHQPPVNIIDRLIDPHALNDYLLHNELPIVLSGYDHGAYAHIVNTLQNFDMQYDLLGTESYFVVMAADNPLAAKPLLTAAEIRHAKMIANSLDIPYNYRVKQLYSPNTIFVKNLAYALEIIKSSDYITTLSGIIRSHEDVSSGQVVMRPIADFTYQLDYLVIYPSAEQLSEPISQAVTLIKDYFQKL